MASVSEDGNNQEERINRALCWDIETWSRIVSLVSTIQYSITVFIIIHELILALMGEDEITGKFFAYTVAGLIICSVGISASIILLIGVDMKIPLYLYAWTICTNAIIMTVLIITGCIVYSGEQNQRSTSILLPLLLSLCVLNHSATWLVNAGRKELEKQRALQMMRMKSDSEPQNGSPPQENYSIDIRVNNTSTPAQPKLDTGSCAQVKAVAPTHANIQYQPCISQVRTCQVKVQVVNPLYINIGTQLLGKQPTQMKTRAKLPTDSCAESQLTILRQKLQAKVETDIPTYANVASQAQAHVKTLKCKNYMPYKYILDEKV